MIITEIQYFFSKIIRFQAIFKDTVEFTCALEFKISSQLEYFCTRILLCSSMGRISRVRDRKLRKSLREETFVFLRENFPEYRKNPYLGNGLKGRYLRIATPALCGICGGTIGRCRPGGLPG